MGAPAVEPPNNSTWRSSALAGTTEQMLSAAVTRRARAAGALCGAGAQKRRGAAPRTATCGRLPGWRQASASWIREGHGVTRALSAAAVLTKTTKFRMDRRVSTLSAHRARAPRKAGWWSRAARRRGSDWLGTSAGSIGTRPAPSGSPVSAWAAGASGERRAKIGWFGTQNENRDGGPNK